jgi:hypothetical protein
MPERIIHIQWDGPFSLNQVPSLDDATKDRGVYQVYAYHPVYGTEQLVYIGQTWGQTFAARVSQHDWGGGTENDPHHVAIYIGRLKGERTPPEQDWSREIALAERLLIHSHGPASCNLPDGYRSNPLAANGNRVADRSPSRGRQRRTPPHQL